MVSIDGGTDLGGRGMSIASQRAKELENRTSDVEVTVKMVKLGKLKLAWAVLPLVWAVVPLVWVVVPLVSGFSRLFRLKQGLAVVPFAGRWYRLWCSAVVPLGGR